MTYLETYSVLHVSKIEGIDVLAGRFDNIYKNMKQKSYDILDHRKTDFDHDFEEFKVRINELEVSWSWFKFSFQQEISLCLRSSAYKGEMLFS